MPELPEVETLRRGLARCLTGTSITAVHVFVPKMLAGSVTDPAAFEAALRGRRIEKIDRRGKHLIFCLDCGYYLLLHLKMRGQLLVTEHSAAQEKYLAALLEMQTGCDLRFHDMWTWGELRLLTQSELAAHPPLAGMGPEPLADGWKPEHFQQALSRRSRTAVKSALLDQTVVAGIGNIYADESLFRAGILPQRLAGEISAEAVRRLHREIGIVLTEATDGGGTTSDNYVDAEGRVGRYQPRVYDRAGQPCVQCYATLVRTKVSGRGTTHCPVCQH